MPLYVTVPSHKVLVFLYCDIQSHLWVLISRTFMFSLFRITSCPMYSLQDFCLSLFYVIRRFECGPHREQYWQVLVAHCFLFKYHQEGAAFNSLAEVYFSTSVSSPPFSCMNPCDTSNAFFVLVGFRKETHCMHLLLSIVIRPGTENIYKVNLYTLK